MKGLKEQMDEKLKRQLMGKRKRPFDDAENEAGNVIK